MQQSPIACTVGDCLSLLAIVQMGELLADSRLFRLAFLYRNGCLTFDGLAVILESGKIQCSLAVNDLQIKGLLQLKGRYTIIVRYG